MTLPDASEDLEVLLRRIIREEAGVTLVTPASKWRGGALVLRPGTPGLQDKSWPIETFFHKVVMLRNRLRTLEQHVNASDLPDDVKVKLQTYISGCYGSLTSFNVLFADEADQFGLIALNVLAFLVELAQPSEAALQVVHPGLGRRAAGILSCAAIIPPTIPLPFWSHAAAPRCSSTAAGSTSAATCSSSGSSATTSRT